jgi:23S rRNA C2498 (ribose-2'-O)-methylase RlmM
VNGKRKHSAERKKKKKKKKKVEQNKHQMDISILKNEPAAPSKTTLMSTFALAAICNNQTQQSKLREERE